MQLEGIQLGHYTLLRLLKRGGMGEVYLAQDTVLPRQVAIKVMQNEKTLYPNSTGSEDAARLFQREMRAITQFDHPHILPLYDYGEQNVNGTPLIYMVMPYRQEGSLSDWIQQRGSSAPLAPEVVAHIIGQAADALQHAHERKTIHMDVKPSNFLVRERREQPGRPDVLLADFGIAKITTNTRGKSMTLRGTLEYMAPEQWNGMPVSASDQYALAIMAYELLTGSVPFQGNMTQLLYQHLQAQPQPPSKLNPRLSPAIDTVILRALEKKPEARFLSVRDFALALQRAVEFQGDIRSTLSISTNEAIHGTTRTLTLPGGRRATVTIPINARDGQIVRLDGYGEPAEDGTRGALILTLAVKREEKPALAAQNEGEMHTMFSSNMASAPSLPSSTPYSASPVVLPPTSTPYQTPPFAPPPADPNYAPPAPSYGSPVFSSEQPVPSCATPQPPPPYRYSTPVDNAPSYHAPPKRTSRVGLFVLLGVALLLVISSIIGFTLYQNHNHQTATTLTSNPTPNATAQANTRATQVAVTQLTATTVAQANATATTSKANPYPYSGPKGVLALYDPLHDNSFGSKWNIANASNGKCSFVNGSYHISTSTTNYTFYCTADASGLTYSNFAYQADMKIIKGNAGGLAFRIADTNNTKLYYFRVTQDGQYALIEFGANNQIIIRGSSAAIHTGLNQTNTVGIVANGTKIDLYVNNQYVDSANDPTYAQGQIGLAANDITDSTEVVFSNAKLWKLP